MDIKESVGSLLQKDVDRAEFLRHAGIALLVAAGLGRFLKSATKSQVQQPTASRGYGQTINLRSR